jgi:hypothetical protein
MKWLADENFDNNILRGIIRRLPEFDVVRAQDLAEIAGSEDPAVLAWATANRRILLTHDVSTMIPALREQLEQFGACSPILFVRDSLPVTLVIEEILPLDECSVEGRQALFTSRFDSEQRWIYDNQSRFTGRASGRDFLYRVECFNSG